MAIVEELFLEGNAEDALNDAADAADAYSAALGEANAAGSDVDAGGFQACEDAAGDATGEVNALADAAGDAGSAMGDAGADGTSAFEGLGEMVQSLNAALEVGKKAAQVAMAVGKIGLAFAKGVSDAKVWGDAAKAALDQITGGRGEEALASIARQAKGLGIATESAVEQFTALRDAGASNADASALIALRADLEAVGVSSADAESAVKKALDGIKSGKDSSKVIADVAKGFGAVGDGANAAAKRSLTWAGALQNLQGFGARAFGVIAEKAGPALDAIGAKITSVMDAFEDSGTIEALGETIGSALEYVPAIIDGILAAWDSFAAAAGPGIDTLSGAFDYLSDALGGTEGGMSAASMIGTALGHVIGELANVITVAVGTAAAFVSAWNGISGAVSAAVDAISGAMGSIGDIDLASIGMNLVQGFINGITDMIGAVASAAAAVGEAAAGALGISLELGSPSKLTRRFGNWTGEGFEIGMGESMPEEIAAPDFAPPANDVGDVLPPMAGAASADVAAPAGAPGRIEVTITINGGAAEDVKTAARRASEEVLERAGLTVIRRAS